MWRWADVKMSRCERRCEDEQMWRWADVREDVKMSRCEDEQMWEKMWEKMWRWADVKMSRCEDEQMWEKMWEKIWRWADERRCERRCERRYEDEQMWRWADVKMSRCEDEQMWEKMWRWADVKMRRCEDEKMRYRPPLLEEPCAQTLSGKNPVEAFTKVGHSVDHSSSESRLALALRQSICVLVQSVWAGRCCELLQGLNKTWKAYHRTSRLKLRSPRQHGNIRPCFWKPINLQTFGVTRCTGLAYNPSSEPKSGWRSKLPIRRTCHFHTFANMLRYIYI